eukprot:5809020-Amphidinium_carterae.1
MPSEYARTATQFTTQDYFFVDDIEHETQRTDVAGWYSRKDYDYQYQIKAGEWLEQLMGNHRTITVGHYMELK